MELTANKGQMLDLRAYFNITVEQANILQVSFKSNALYILNLLELVREREEINNTNMNITLFSKFIISPVIIDQKSEGAWWRFDLKQHIKTY